MATINLGNIKFNWQGTYAGGTAYAVDDVVFYNGSSYICKLASTGNLPTNNTYWDQMSSAGTNGTDLTSTLTTQGDLVYRDGSGLQRLGAGTAGQVLQTGGAGANPSWSTVSSDFVKLGESYQTGVSEVSVDGYYTSDYDVYVYEVYDIINTVANRGFHMYFNIGGTIQTSANYYTAFMQDYYSSSGNNFSSGGQWGGNHFPTAFDLSSSSNMPSAVTYTVYRPLDSGNNPYVKMSTLINGQNQSYVVIGKGACWYASNTATSGLSFRPQSDTFSRIRVKLYGLKA